MSTEIKVPALPESVADATVLQWHKAPGEAVSRDDNLVDLRTKSWGLCLWVRPQEHQWKGSNWQQEQPSQHVDESLLPGREIALSGSYIQLGKSLRRIQANSKLPPLSIKFLA